MFGIGLVELALVIVVPALAATMCVALATRPRGTFSVAREWRWVRRIRLLGIALGLLIATVLMDHASLAAGGVGTMIAPPGFGLGVLLGVVAGETIVRAPRPTGPRTASLQHRSLGTYLPRPTSYAVTTGLALLGATLLLTTFTAQDDDYLGQRAIGCQAGPITQSHSPYPGAFYAVPLAIMLGIVLVSAAIAAVAVVRRPRGLASTDAGDDDLRRRSMTVIVAAVGVAVGTSLTGTAATAAAGLLSLDVECAPAWMPVAGWLLVPTALIGLGLGAWCLVRLFVNDSLSNAADPTARTAPEHA
ncbi:hypothetical protein ACFVDI_27960 [Nocardioides sp. NPDC057767]|uniref:hypothetical protein n=1 Tax=unclassified Nocardioides TaxID=2615069 RepID=UPI00366AE9F3